MGWDHDMQAEGPLAHAIAGTWMPGVGNPG